MGSGIKGVGSGVEGWKVGSGIREVGSGIRDWKVRSGIEGGGIRYQWGGIRD